MQKSEMCISFFPSGPLQQTGAAVFVKLAQPPVDSHVAAKRQNVLIFMRKISLRRVKHSSSGKSAFPDGESATFKTFLLVGP